MNLLDFNSLNFLQQLFNIGEALPHLLFGQSQQVSIDSADKFPQVLQVLRKLEA